ncbi:MULTISPECIES: hypothetical protein [unclassified Crossiella]|uniref:hypothetical protein n=1 Tax=unclassified Crossiella TaxID=2620835 RepID=UPI001FFF089C|nr:MULTISPECIES: hypothetical protein [unclassified Crossiella]MCK2245436.1 hypothetical protein [Crossiella sp. S99.2]MCK2259088.1 hypothetical protein [Crossiella sp. S99.1]
MAREVVSAGLRAPREQDRTTAALLAIREHVAPEQIEAFWVALIEHTINTISTFLAVYGDEVATRRTPDAPSGPVAQNLPLDLVNAALDHATKGDYTTVADLVRQMATLDDQQHAMALGNIVHMALVVGEIVRGHRSGESVTG